MPTDPNHPPPPVVPRPLTPLATWRAWTEPSVRLWWLLALAVIVAIGVYAADRLWARHAENQLISAGVAVRATVRGTPNHQTAGQTADADDEATVSFYWHGQPQAVSGTLTRSTTVGATIPIHVDPADPTRWTDQVEATPLLDALFVGLLLLPIVPVLAAVAAVRRRAVVRTWRLGRAAVAVVSDRRQVPIAPMSYAVRCSLREGPDRRIRTVYVPRAGRTLVEGDELAVILPPRRGRPVAAMWFG